MYSMDKKTCFLLTVHGSAHTAAREGMVRFGRDLEAMQLGFPVRVCFLRMSEPSLADSMEIAAQEGYRRIVVLPLLVFSGQHLAEEIPEIIEKFKQRYPAVTASLQPPLAGTPSFLDWLSKELISLSGLPTK